MFECWSIFCHFPEGTDAIANDTVVTCEVYVELRGPLTATTAFAHADSGLSYNEVAMKGEVSTDHYNCTVKKKQNN